MLQLGDIIDARDEEMGAWFEARIVKISPLNNNVSTASDNKRTDDSQQLQSSSRVETSDTSDEHTVSSVTSKTSPATDDAVDDEFLYSIVFERLVCCHHSSLLLAGQQEDRQLQ